MKYEINRLKTTKEIRPLVDRHWSELRTAKERGEIVGWASGPTFIFPYAMEMKCHFMAGYAAYCGGIGAADDVLRAAELAGELPDTCSYHRLHMGMAEAVRKELPIKKEAILPIPDVMIAGRYCTEMSHYAESLYRRLGVRVLPIELPIPFEKEDIERLGEYVIDQTMETVIPTLEEICGKPFDYERMGEILEVLKKTALLRNECWEFFKKKPSPWSLWDYGVSIAPVFYMMGKPESITYYKHLRDELRERTEKGIPAILPDGEKYRIYWDGWLPWAFLGRFIRKFIQYGALPICGRYPWEFFPHPEKIDPKDPIRTWWEQYYSPHGTAYHLSPKGAFEFIGEVIEEYSIDGMVMFSSKTCRIWNLAQLEIVNAIEKEYGIPGVVVEADMIDPAMVSDAQVETRLQALFEMIEARK
ncbi:MAG: 2-hydroxyacyl-CoA dehydratase subunit D [Candidatus Syntropharchaeia archaeon]